MVPYIVFWVDKLPEGVGGCAQGPIIRVRKKYKDVDPGILAHEIEHVRQWWVTLTLHSLLYLFSQKYRLWSEVKAYNRQLSFETDPERRERRKQQFAYAIANKYKISVSQEQAYEKLD